MRTLLTGRGLSTVVMEQHAFARTQDSSLLEFLHTIRTTQPKLPYIKKFFGDHYLGLHLARAVRACLLLRTRDQTPVTWLTCTGKGAMEVNYEYLRQLGYGTPHEMAQQPDAYPCDIDYGALPMIVRPGMWLRLTRNLDKKRGFCNGAMGQVVDLLRSDSQAVVFTMRLTHGAMVIVHPIQQGDQRFLPCVYGYAMTTRKAQGSSMDFVVLYFDLFKAAPRGFGYVGASRARSSAGLFYFGKVRRTDWLPVGGDANEEQVTRGYDSKDSSSEGRARSYDESDDDQEYQESSDGSLGEVEEAMFLDSQNIRDVDYDDARSQILIVHLWVMPLRNATTLWVLHRKTMTWMAATLMWTMIMRGSQIPTVAPRVRPLRNAMTRRAAMLMTRTMRMLRWEFLVCLCRSLSLCAHYSPACETKTK